MLFLCFQGKLMAQWTPEEKQQIIEERIEYIAQDLESEDIDFTTLFDNLDQLIEQPINLNEASIEELKESLLFNEIQIAGIMAHRKRYGNFVSIYELKYVDGFNASNISFVLPFIGVAQAQQKEKFETKYLLKGRNTMIIRGQRVLESAVAYSPIDSTTSQNQHYLGDPNRIYARWRYQAGKNLSLGLTGEKDPGEEFFRGTQTRGFDFYSAHLALNQVGPVKTLILGDYQAQFGQGLVIWTGFGFRKSSQQALNTRRFARGFVPYTSVDENNFMRGGAATLNFKQLEASFFYSSKLVDANLDTSNADDIGNADFTSLQQTGFHRTPAELFDKDAVREKVYGVNLNYRFNNLRIGATGVQSMFEGNFDPNPQLYNAFTLQANQNRNAGVHYEWTNSAFQIYGEYALSENGASAQLHGISINAREILKLNILYRNKEPAFQNLYANSFGERSISSNEKGWYHGLEILPFKNMSVQAYLDLYEFPWLSFRADAPTGGYESSVFVRYILTRKTELSGLYRAEERGRNSPAETLRVQELEKEKLEQFRLQLDYEASRQLSFRSRLEYRRYRLGQTTDFEEGYMLFQDVAYSLPSSKFNFRFRYALFSSSSFNTRIYAYENDMRFQFSVPAYFGEGSRSYLLINYKASNAIQFSFRIAQTFRLDSELLGSGIDAIQGPRRTEIKSQFIFRF